MKNSVMILLFVLWHVATSKADRPFFQSLENKDIDACAEQAEKDARTEKKEVCFTRKQAYCILYAQARRKLAVEQYKAQAEAAQKLFLLQMSKKDALYQADLRACRQQVALLARHRCQNPAISWSVGTTAGFLGGVLVGGGVCAAIQRK